MHMFPSITAFAAVAQLWLGTGHARLLGIPTEPFDETTGANAGSYALEQLQSIVVDGRFTNATDTTGETLIPPTLGSFAQTFSEDLASSLGLDVPVQQGSKAATDSIFLTIGNPDDFKDVAGRNTAEGYTLAVTSDGITITGASPLGAWWATRSILQQATLGDSELPYGSGTNSPGWKNRGMMLDVGRHYYPPDFLIEMCSYISFFKQNVFHVHMSDNLIFDPDFYSNDPAAGQYVAFRPNSDDPAVAGLASPSNESYYRSDLDNIQRKCADRGVTVIPEIEAPGHAQVITRWRPQLALSTDKSMLNISHPETIPTMRSVWKTFLPWFHSKTVHIGADEYDRTLVDDYMRFVNAMNEVIQEESSKEIRIWGTFASSESDVEVVNKSVSIQHWYVDMANPYDYIREGYKVLNSDSSFYIVPKHLGYPQTLPVDRVFSGNPAGGAFAPNILDAKNIANNPPVDEPNILGHVAALWNDPGPNGTTYSEAFYAYREGLPALADKQWGGDIVLDEFNSVFEKLLTAIPGQNLGRTIKSTSNTILQYLFAESGSKVIDSSGNHYDGTSKGCSIESSVITFGDGCYLETPLSSKGRDYTLSFSAKQNSANPSKLFSGPDSELLSGNGTITNVMLVAAGNAFVLDYSLPVNTWSDVSLIGRGNATFLTVSSGNKTVTKEFVAGLGLSAGQGPSEINIAIEAPLARIGEGFEGSMKSITLIGSA